MRSPEWIHDVSTVFRSPYDAREDFLEGLEDAGRDLSKDQKRRVSEVFGRLDGLRQYQFEVVHIQKDVDKRLVADIFVRTDSEGVNLKSYDYILTWLSVFWPRAATRSKTSREALGCHPSVQLTNVDDPHEGARLDLSLIHI